MSEGAAPSFSRALKALAVSALGGAAVLLLSIAADAMTQAGTTVTQIVGVGLLMLPYSFAAAAIFVLPLLAIWPASRRPGDVIGAMWGLVAAFCAVVMFFGIEMFAYLPAVLCFGLAGASSGMLYAHLIRR